MNKQPVYYLQTDPRWKDKPYRVPGESATVGNSGCGPSCAAMLIETLTGRTYTPEAACNWSVQHGYKALKQGTYYSYFKPQFAAFGIDCDQLSWVNTYGKPDHANHDKALELLMQGYYIIACMGPGTWTTSGHFVVMWWQDGKVRINDPASTKDARLNGDIRTFRSQVKYYWWVDARKFNKEDDIMTGKEIVEALTPDQCLAILREARATLQDNDSSAYSEEARQWAVDTGLVAGGSEDTFNGMWEDVLTREQLVTVLYRFAKLAGLISEH